MYVPVSLWSFVGSGALSYMSVPFLIRGIKDQAPGIYKELGEPTFSTIFSRDPTKWKMQRRFTWFVVSGRAFSNTYGSVRFAAVAAIVAYIGVITSILFLILNIVGMDAKD